jgi:stearoyl-CoA desaturase (delta-9 desaturase)
VGESKELQRIRPAPEERVRVRHVLPSMVIHAMCLGVIWVGFSWVAAGVAAALFLGRMFIITAFYHRYFSHRTFRVHRVTQALAAFAGTTCAQRGPIWWAAHHREHHRHSDHEPDIHSPGLRGVIYAHMGWFNSDRGMKTMWPAVPDWQKVPELLWIERNHLIGPIVLGLAMFGLGAILERFAPGLGTSGWQMLVWGFAISTTLLYHATFTINSLAHMFGSRRFATADDSRNNWLLAVLTLGEGWHNNHHYYPGSARQGFYWWEFDPTYYVLRLLGMVGLVWDINPVPSRVYAAAERESQAGRQAGMGS